MRQKQSWGLLLLLVHSLHFHSGACEWNVPHAAVEGLSNDPSEAAFVKLKSDLTEGSLGEGLGWFEPCDPGPEPNYYYSVNLRGWEEGRGDIQFQENRKEEVCGEVLYKFTNIQKQKQKKSTSFK